MEIIWASMGRMHGTIPMTYPQILAELSHGFRPTSSFAWAAFIHLNGLSSPVILGFITATASVLHILLGLVRRVGAGDHGWLPRNDLPQFQPPGGADPEVRMAGPWSPARRFDVSPGLDHGAGGQHGCAIMCWTLGRGDQPFWLLGNSWCFSEWWLVMAEKWQRWLVDLVVAEIYCIMMASNSW